MHQTCRADNRDYISAMRKIYLIALLLAVLTIGAGCKTHSGSREYVPGNGWVPND